MVKIVKAQKPLLIKKIFQNKIAATYKVQKRMLKNLIKPNQIKIHKIYFEKLNKFLLLRQLSEREAAENAKTTKEENI